MDEVDLLSSDLLCVSVFLLIYLWKKKLRKEEKEDVLTLGQFSETVFLMVST